jgi:hypothetical protein
MLVCAKCAEGCGFSTGLAATQDDKDPVPATMNKAIGKLLDVLRAGGDCWRPQRVPRSRRWFLLPPGNQRGRGISNTTVEAALDQGCVEAVENGPDVYLKLATPEVRPNT